ncbi:MAG TPA: nucleotide pyrophosphohydrolase [Acidimicrobiales bacterium]|nr:nucleotide pyrophosphohydrolase [Acidimicrobiales bacterium]
MADLTELQDRIAEFVEVRRWGEFQTPKNLAMALTGEVGELVEILQWLTPEQAKAAGSDAQLRPRLEDEVADVLIYLLSLARSLDIDALEAALAKVTRNELRFPRDP